MRPDLAVGADLRQRPVQKPPGIVVDNRPLPVVLDVILTEGIVPKRQSRARCISGNSHLLVDRRPALDVALISDPQAHGLRTRPNHSRGVDRWAWGTPRGPVGPVPCYFESAIANQVVARNLRWSTGWCGCRGTSRGECGCWCRSVSRRLRGCIGRCRGGRGRDG